MVLIGPGGDGKTKLVQTVARLVGSDAVYSGDVARLETSPFCIGGLVGKLLFIDDDVKAGARLPDGILKKVSEGKELTGERKHKDPFNFVCRALPVLLCNNIPSIADLSYGIRRRLLVFKCERQFTEKEQDKTLFNRIWAGEMPGVLNRALQGWSEFVNNKFEFDGSQDLRKGKTDLLVQANPLAAYIDERWEKEPSASVSITDLYVDFTRWSQDSGYNFPVVKNKLRRQVADLGYTVKLVNGYAYAMGLKPKKQAGSNG